ncbi:uncharacterized protein BCR38DRAFT_400322 [Pseudomassariella vexata]|uniref:Rhodopsin domain-containing protein n=1 Tax=Pseudomassariella vexata TaxID=1141098 RepID=A0A1Y2DH13_9PEZI|nr:uncharacterized protein BCR38DRAFT_400322 [Pseudomassariella vexata]ORY58542.1 hypothetical protein BCR38DRAFT_400322 [Pseudomassariella vexata]
MSLEPRLAIFTNETENPVEIFNSGLVPPSTEGWRIIGSGIVLLFLTALWTYMRYWSRKEIGRPFMLEDGLNLAAVIIFYGLVANNFVMVLVGGMGHHMYELQPWHVVRLSKATYACQLLYAASMGLVKISIIRMFMRIFFVRRFQIAGVIVMGFSIAWMILTMLIGILICQPIQMNWDPATPGGRCGDQVAAFSSVGIIDVINEFSMLLLPIPMIWKIHVHRRYKVLIGCMFGAGILTMIFGAVRLYEVLQVEFTDTAYTAVNVTTYSAVECGVAIIVSSSPLLKPVSDKMFGRFLAKTEKLNQGPDWKEKETR